MALVMLTNNEWLIYLIIAIPAVLVALIMFDAGKRKGK